MARGMLLSGNERLAVWMDRSPTAPAVPTHVGGGTPDGRVRFRDELIAEYKRFWQSFTIIQAGIISRVVDAAYAGFGFWPALLIELNSSFEWGGWIDNLMAEATPDTESAQILRLNHASDTFGERLLLHLHQAGAIAIAARREKYILITGIGSGKSLAYFIPIVDRVLRRKRAGDACKDITVIVDYPMKGLCNSQRAGLGKYLDR